MNKGIIAIAAVVVIALGAGVFMASGSESEDTASTSQTTNEDTDAAPAASSQAPTASTEADSDEIEVASAGTNTIQEYSADALSASTTENNLLFFHASWCSVCNSVERNIEAGNIPDDLSIFKIDYDSDEGQVLAGEYSIPVQFTMVQVDTAGSEITQWVNNFGDGITEVNAKIQNS